VKSAPLVQSAQISKALPLAVQVAALETAVTQLQKQVNSLQTMLDMMQAAQNHGFNSSGLASFQILSSPGMSNVVIPFFGN
jgi:hypothetical protein